LISPLTDRRKWLSLTVLKAAMTRVSSNGRQRRLSEHDRYTLRRHEDFCAAAGYVAEALARVPAVKRIALVSSVASPPRVESGRRGVYLHHPKDVDLAVWLDDVTDLDALRKLSSTTLNRLWGDKEIAHHQVDIFLLDAVGKYLGPSLPLQSMPETQTRVSCAGLRKHPISPAA
jgi:hypothetical protein